MRYRTIEITSFFFQIMSYCARFFGEGNQVVLEETFGMLFFFPDFCFVLVCVCPEPSVYIHGSQLA